MDRRGLIYVLLSPRDSWEPGTGSWEERKKKESGEMFILNQIVEIGGNFVFYLGIDVCIMMKAVRFNFKSTILHSK